MKKFVFILVLGIILAGLAFAWQSHRGYTSDKIDNEHIYVFEQSTCPHCHHAKAYLTQAYPNLPIQYRDIAQKENLTDFLACADKFYLNKETLGTPLICMGQHFILGWGEDQQKQFDEYVQAFIQKEQKAQ